MRLCLGPLKNASALAPLNRAGEQIGHGLFFDDPDALVIKQAPDASGSERRSCVSIGNAMSHHSPPLTTPHDPSFAMTFADVRYYVQAKTGGTMHWVHLVVDDDSEWSASQLQESVLFAKLGQMRSQAMLNTIHTLWGTTILLCHYNTSWDYEVVPHEDNEAYTCINISNQTVHTISVKGHNSPRSVNTLGRMVHWTAHAISERGDPAVAPHDRKCNLWMCHGGMGAIDGATAMDVLYSAPWTWYPASLRAVLDHSDDLLVLDLSLGLCLWGIGQTEPMILKSWNQLTADGDVIHIRDPICGLHGTAITSVHTGAAVHCAPKGDDGVDYVYVPPPPPLMSKFTISAVVHHTVETVHVGGVELTIGTIDSQKQWLQRHCYSKQAHTLQLVTSKKKWEADNGLDSSTVTEEVSDGRPMMYLMTYDETASLVPNSERYLGRNLLSDAIEDTSVGNERRLFIPIRMADDRLRIQLMWHGGSGRWTRAPDDLRPLLQGAGRNCFTELTITGGRPATSRMSGDVVVSGGIGVHGEVHCRSVVTLSDQAFKEDIQELNSDDCLQKVQQWKPSSFRWCESKKYDTGFIAQELLSSHSAPHCVHTDTEAGTVSVNYNSMLAYLTGAVKQLATNLDNLTRVVGRLEKRQRLE
jgi:hypothetical protein